MALDDADLDALLDSCLEELDDDHRAPAASSQSAGTSSSSQSAEDIIAAGARAAVSDGLGEAKTTGNPDATGDAQLDQLASMFEEIFKIMDGPLPDPSISPASSSSTSSSAATPPAGPPMDEKEAEELASNLESLLQKLEGDEQQRETSPEDHSGSNNDDDPLLEGFMKFLMSKDILYQPMKDMLVRYDEYLADGSQVLTEEERSKCVLQRGYVAEIVSALETNPDDRKHIFELVQLMEQSGQPPAPLASSIFPDFSNPSLPNLFSALSPDTPMPDFSSFAQMLGSSSTPDKNCTIC